MYARSTEVVALIAQLRARREEMHVYCCNSLLRFRRDGMIVPLADSVRELVRNLKGQSECILEWSAFLMELDLVSMLLRVEAIARREIAVSKEEAIEMILLVWELLPAGAYWSYVGGEKEDEGEEIIRHAWAVMLNQKDLDGEKFGQLSREMYGLVRGLRAHGARYHVNGNAHECQEYRRVVEGWAEGERLMAA
jgi:hypothetical protein